MKTLATLREQLFLTVPEAAAILRTDPRTLRRAIAAGHITAVRINGAVRIPTQRFLAEVHLEPADRPDGGQVLSTTSAAPAQEAVGLTLVVDRAPPDPSAA